MSSSFYIKLGKKISTLRRKIPLSREKFSEQIGLNDYYLGEIERGEKKPSLDTLFKISDGLNLKIHELLDLSKK